MPNHREYTLHDLKNAVLGYETFEEKEPLKERQCSLLELLKQVCLQDDKENHKTQ